MRGLSQSERSGGAGIAALARHTRGSQAMGVGRREPLVPRGATAPERAGGDVRLGGLAWLLLCGAYRDLRMDRLQRPWKHIREEVPQWWGDLTDDDLDRIAGERDK